MAGLHVPLSTLRHSPRGPSTHDLGPPWIATPSMSGVLIPFLMPVYPGAFPTFTTTRSTRSVPSSPRQPRQGYAAALPPGLPDRPLPTGCGVARRIRGGRALLTGPDPPGWGPARRLRASTLVPRVHLPVLLAGPGPSGSADP